MSDPLRDFLNTAKAIQADMDKLGVSQPPAPPIPRDDIERLLRASEWTLGLTREGNMLLRRVQRWLDSLPKKEADDAHQP